MVNIRIAIAAVKAVVAIVRGVWNSVASVTRVLWAIIKAVVAGAIKGILVAVRVVNKVRDVVRRAWQTVKDVTSTIWNGLKSVVGGVVDWMWKKISGVWDRLKGVYGKIKGLFGGEGKTEHIGKAAARSRRTALSAGAWVPPRPGGLAATLAEGGEGEYVVPQSKVMRFALAALAGGSSSQQTGGSSSQQTVINLGGIRIENLHGTDRRAAEAFADQVVSLVEAKLAKRKRLTTRTAY